MAITLATVEDAIAQVETSGQSGAVDGIAYSRANLSALLALRDTLKRESERTSGARPVFRGFNFTSAGY